MGNLRKLITTRPRTIAAIATSLLLLGVYFSIIILYTINFPFFDDYHAVLEFLSKYIQEESGLKRIGLLLSQHNEHRIIVERLATVSYYSLFHKLNFISLTVIGNLAIPLLLFYIFKSIPTLREESILYFLPIVFLIVNFHYYNITFWAMGSLQNLWVLALAVITLYYLSLPQNSSLIFAGSFGLLTTFSSGNGMLVFVVGTLVLFLNNGINKKLILWMIIGVSGITFYFLGYSKPDTSGTVNAILSNPLSIIHYCLLFIGSSSPSTQETSTLYPLLLGIFLTLFTAFLFYKKYFKKNIAVFSVLLFLLLTAGIASIGRIGLGPEQALASRYTVISSLYIACCYIAFIELYIDRLKKTPIVLIVLFIIPILFHVSTCQFLTVIIDDKIEFETKTRLREQGIYSNLSLGWPLPDKSEPKRILQIADRLNIYPFKDNYSFSTENLPFCVECKSTGDVDIYRNNNENIAIFGWAFISHVNSDSLLTTLQLLDSMNHVVKEGPCENQRRKDVTEYHKADNTNYNSSGYFCECSTKKINSGTYKVTVLLANKRYKHSIDTGKRIEILN